MLGNGAKYRGGRHGSAIILWAAAGLLAAGCSAVLDGGGSRAEPISTAALVRGDTMAAWAGPSGDDSTVRRRGRPRPERKPPVLASDLQPASAVGNTGGADDPSGLIGLGLGEAELLFGPPDRQREGLPARIWQYADAGCEVQLYFYFELTEKRYRLLHYTATHGATPAGAGPGKPSPRCAWLFKRRVEGGG